MKSNRKRQMRRKRRAVSYVMGEKQEEVSDNSQASEMPQNNSQNRITKMFVEQGRRKSGWPTLLVVDDPRQVKARRSGVGCSELHH
jgi:hypothetical protein